MKIYKYPARSEWKSLVKRPSLDVTQLFDVIRPIVDEVSARGDAALFDFEERFDQVRPERLLVSESEIASAAEQVDAALQDAIRQAYTQIERFHSAQRFSKIQVETAPGVLCEQRAVPISRVGLYIPGGSAPLFSTVLMLGIPARIAGCRQVVLCTPPRKDGTVHPAILFAASLCGITAVYKVGGAQAIAAMAVGTESVPRVDKIFGPGNQYVMAAKQWVSLRGVAIDMPAGPSEVEVLADETAHPEFVAADLLSQAEHGPDSQAMLVTTSQELAKAVAAEVERQLAELPRRDIARKALESSKTVVLSSMSDAIEFTNAYAPEHLVVATAMPGYVGQQIRHAGSIFLGHFSCESAGDYASGTNHTLPTMGYARSYSGLCLDSFMRKITYQELTPEGILSIGRAVELMAAAEELEGHRRAMSVRVAACRAARDAETRGEISALVRPNVLAMAPYSCARDEYSGHEATVFLDANENPYNAPVNRYPDPQQTLLKERLAQLKGVKPGQIFLGNGSDEAIDLVFRVFCRPGVDNVVAIEPTYGMYAVCAATNDVEYRRVMLNADFTFTASRLLEATDAHTKAIFLCSPNNPTGNLLPRHEIESLLRSFPGIVVVDEAYGDFAPGASVVAWVNTYPRLMVLSTFSKAWASAGIRLGAAITSEEIVEYLNKIKYPYNVNILTQQQALQMLDRQDEITGWVEQILVERQRMAEALKVLDICEKVYPSDANFLLVKVPDAPFVYDELARRGIIVRNRSRVSLCHNCLRITIGTPDENNSLLAALKDLEMR